MGRRLGKGSELGRQVAAEQLRVHYIQIPAMAIAPTAGAAFTAWVLWGAVNNRYLVIGVAAVVAISAVRLLVHRWYLAAGPQRGYEARWRYFAVGSSLLSGCVWGGAPILLYPPLAPGYEVFLLVLLALIPVVPMAALAPYLPAFFSYYLPSFVPFVFFLALHDGRAEKMTALLLLMMMGAMIAFAHRYSRTLRDAILFKLELEEKTRALEKASREKVRFFAAASHDLRQPIHALGLFVESWKQRARKRNDRTLVDHVAASLQNLRGMLNDLLDISRLDAAAVSVSEKDFRVAELLAPLRDEYAPLMAQQRLDFRYRVADHAVRSDPKLLERMLRNLLSNAVKYTRRGGVALVCRRRGASVLVQVIDTGIGIEADRLEDIFLEFAQVNHGERDSAKGLGLGLAIVERLAKLLGHRLQVRSRPGSGSVFTIELAMARGAPASLAPATISTPIPNPMVGTVLVIDDNEAVGAGTASLLQQWGNRTIVAATAQQALAKLHELGATPALAIVDYWLAHGTTALDAIRCLNETIGLRLPSIIVTGDTAPACIREAHAAGYPLLHKPVDPQRLSACIAAVLQSDN